MIKNIFFFAFVLFTLPVMAVDFESLKTDEIIAIAHDKNSTDCASQIFSDALYNRADEVSATDDEARVRLWARDVMMSPETLEQILKCPEIIKTDDTQTIVFTPIIFEFANSERTLTINYSTQKKVLKQKILLSRKRSIPNGDPNPKLMDENDPAIYINTDPAWYAIMVVQHDSLSDFVGPDKNNTISLKYLNDNIKSIYPRGYHCTSKSAITPGNNQDVINKVVHEVVDLDKDTNDYYVAGDVNLEWIMYAEIALDVAITIATAGIGEGVMIGAKSARAFRTGKTLTKNMSKLARSSTKVKDYVTNAKRIVKNTDDIADLEKNIKNAEQYERALKRAENARRAGRDATKYEKEAENILENAKKIDPDITENALRNPDGLKSRQKQLSDEIKQLEQESEQLAKENKDVQQYKESAEAFVRLDKYYKELRAFKRPQTGNVITRNLKKIGKTAKAANTGAKTLNQTGRIARAGMSSHSAKIGNWLFDTSLKHGARLGRVYRDIGFIYGAVAFLGDMYDKTSDSTDEFTNGIEFKPLCLLSADDLAGQENVVNYGMWLLWQGNSTDPADDDAAYLQAMDFASKFYYQLDEYQDEHGAQCNVDIYVVRPIIRLDESDPNKTKGELFYLFMNEIPWSTNEQFNKQIADVSDWERVQQQLEETDPDNKYTQPEPITENVDDNVEFETE